MKKAAGAWEKINSGIVEGVGSVSGRGQRGRR